MAKLVISTSKCKGCSICVSTCGSNALAVNNNIAVVNANCTLCGMCLPSCPFNALSIEKSGTTALAQGEYKDVWVFAETLGEKIHPVTAELLGIGKKLALEKGYNLCALLLDHKKENLAKELIHYGADKVFICSKENTHSYDEENLTEIICNLIKNRNPDILLFGATSFGRSLAPRIAARVKTGLTADCTLLAINKETGLLHQTRPAFGGNLMATIVCPHHKPQMATVRPGVMAALAKDVHRTGAIVRVASPSKNSKNKLVIRQSTYENNLNQIANAKILVVAGRGVGTKKNMHLVHEFAKKIGASVGVSRPLVDLGFGQYNQQIGQTGIIVAPKILISLGVSGAIQHLAGITRAEKIIAINTDADAAIFQAAHYKIVGDCMEIVKEFLN